ncbi:MAG: TraR/DksA family transcriptional regulator [Solirubrobacterales bacterium]
MANAKPEIDEGRARELLRRERERVESALAEIERARRSEIDEGDTATAAEDDAEVIEEEARDDARARQVRAELAAIERAEKRLGDGTFGVSVESGEPIPAARLEAVPWAERTASEQERYERSGGGT